MATVWIDRDSCIGAGTCEQIAPAVFHPRGDGTWAVKKDLPHFPQRMVFDGGSGPGHGPEGFEGRARVPDHYLDLVVEAAEECPGDCIFIDF